ncbi:MAG: type-F conjugative transfer system secretin TraK, partial [Alphaproteobacteria bacterium]
MKTRMSKTTIKSALSAQVLLLWLCGGLMAHAASQNIPMDAGKRVKAVIAKDSMNRFAVANDRIVQVFGDEQSYMAETESTIGQIFLKPTLENGDKPLSLTVITENGIVQDMTLVPTERDAATIILT